MSSLRLAYGSLHHAGAGLLPRDLEGVDYLLLDGGLPRVANPAEPPLLDLLRRSCKQLGPVIYLNPTLHVVVRLAGESPAAAARVIAEELVEAGSIDLPIGIAKGHDVLPRLEEFLACGIDLRHAETDQPFVELRDPTQAATVALGPEPMEEMFREGARFALLGDSALSDIAFGLGSLAFGWKPENESYQTAMQTFGQQLAIIGSATATIDIDADASQHWLSAMPAEVNRSEALSPDQATVTIRYREAYACVAMLQSVALTTDDAFAEAVGLVLSGIKIRGRDNPAIVRETWHSPGNSTLTGQSQSREVIRYASPDETFVSEMLSQLQLWCGSFSDRVQLSSEFPPRVFPTDRIWPTSLPRSLVEWSIDLRETCEWVE